MNIFESLKRKLFDFVFDAIPNNYSICEENNIAGLYDNDFVITKTENFVGGITLQGINFNAITESNSLDLMFARINALNALSDDIEARIIVKRRELKYNREYNIDNEYAKKLINKWEGNGKIYVNYYFILFETKDKGAKGFFEKKKLELTTSIKEDTTNNVTYLNKITILKSVIERVVQTLSPYEPKKMSSNEIMRLYGEYINGVYFSYAILVKAHSKEELNESSETILNELKNNGLIAVYETLNIQTTFFSMFPNKSNLNARKRIHTSKTISSMILFEKEYIGQTTNSWGNTPITIFKNQSFSPFLFNFHADNNQNVVGHTMIVGGTGAGKTTLLSFLIANLFKYNIDILALDRLNGLYIITEFLNGEYNQGEDFKINPFSLEYDSENVNFLSSWLCAMINLNMNSASADEAQKVKAIEQVVNDNYKHLSKQQINFSLKDIASSVTKTADEQINIQLERYIKDPIFNSEYEFDGECENLVATNEIITNNEMDSLDSINQEPKKEESKLSKLFKFTKDSQ